MPHHISPLKNNSENSRKSPHPTSHFSIEKIIQKNYRKIYYNSLRVINDEFSQHAIMTRHMMSHDLSLLKNNFENSRKIYFLNQSLNYREIKI
jgi:hypothetical protein